MVADAVFLHSIAVLGATALGLGIVAVALLGLWRAMTDEPPLLLFELLVAEGIEWERDVGDVATRKCMQCVARKRCREWLSRRHGEGYQAFCPNADYIARLKGARA